MSDDSDDSDASFAPRNELVSEVALTSSLAGLRLEVLRSVNLCGRFSGDSATEQWQWAWLVRCVSLQELSLDHCNLSEVPPVLAELSGLQVLNASFNRDLRIVPHFLGRLRMLRELSFCRCPIGHVARGLTGLSSSVTSLWLNSAYSCGASAGRLLRGAIGESSDRLRDAVRACRYLLWLCRTRALGPVPREIARKICEAVLDDVVLTSSAEPLPLDRRS